MTTRRPLTRAQRVKVFDRWKGVCHICGFKIHAERGEEWEVEHLKPIWLDGPDTPENMKPAHKQPCHEKKTSEEAGIRAKTDAQRANFLGVPKPGKKMRGHRNDTITITMNLGVQPRLKGKGAKHRKTMENRYGQFGRVE